MYLLGDGSRQEGEDGGKGSSKELHCARRGTLGIDCSFRVCLDRQIKIVRKKVVLKFCPNFFGSLVWILVHGAHDIHLYYEVHYVNENGLETRSVMKPLK
jgi:hypothetical protein